MPIKVVVMGWTPPVRHRCAKVAWKGHAKKEASMNGVAMIGLDLAKNAFQAHGSDSADPVVFRKRLRRDKVLVFFAEQPRCQVRMEACGSAHYWGRELSRIGHDVRLIPPAYVKPFMKRQKNDAADAEAICEAAHRPESFAHFFKRRKLRFGFARPGTGAACSCSALLTTGYRQCAGAEAVHPSGQVIPDSHSRQTFCRWVFIRVCR